MTIIADGMVFWNPEALCGEALCGQTSAFAGLRSLKTVNLIDLRVGDSGTDEP